MSREELIAAMKVTAEAGRVVTPVSVPGWPTVYVRGLTVGEVDANSEADNASKDKRTLARGAARVICDANGERIFDANSDEDVTLIAAQPWPLLQLVVAQANKSNGQGADAGNG